jgi:predicted acyltransferase
VGSVLFGVVAGRWLLTAPSTLGTSARLLAAGVLALVVGLALDYTLMPINKNLWTPSYAVFMTGWSLVAYAAFHAVMDARTFGRRALLPLTIYGMNALFIFAFSGFVARLLIMGDTKRAIYEPIKSLPVSPDMASLLFAIVFNLAMFGVAWFMWKRKWFVRA